MKKRDIVEIVKLVKDRLARDGELGCSLFGGDSPSSPKIPNPHVRYAVSSPRTPTPVDKYGIPDLTDV